MDKLVKIFTLPLFIVIGGFAWPLFEWLANLIDVSLPILGGILFLILLLPIITLFIKKWSDRGKTIDNFAHHIDEFISGVKVVKQSNTTISHHIDEFINGVKVVKQSNKTTTEIIQNTQNLLQKIENVIDLNSQIFMKESELGERKSPIMLNPKGKEIAEKINIAEVLTNIGDAIHQKIADEKLETEYDWQEKIFNFAQFHSDEFLTKDSIKLFKKVAFEEGLVMKDMKFVLGVKLRDFIFDKENLSYKNIKD